MVPVNGPTAQRRVIGTLQNNSNSTPGMGSIQVPFGNVSITSPPGMNGAMGGVGQSNHNGMMARGMDAMSVHQGVRMVPVGGQFVQQNQQLTDEERQQQRNRVSKQQRMLLFLRHCAKCNNGDCQYGKHCQQGRELWNHIGTCKNSECKFSRQNMQDTHAFFGIQEYWQLSGFVQQ
eukprot:TRINITY_DN61714_c0_g1_i2.p3 TRINITY_DN61714_c0_g1~~TRINITY_DN61714_c0_g1_i2.p3  ORF type:complete len:176 (-),score=17.28 TRINITY_DN61714_c0_g1_i2:135-662(-)